MRQKTTLLLIGGALVVGGCSPGRLHRPYSTALNTPQRDTYAAQRLNQEGLGYIEAGDFEAAETSFRQALDHDLFYASAHNNLGLLLLDRGEAYAASWEFTFAAKLLPHAVEPRNNLGLVMEKVAHLDDAIAHYKEALDLDPGNVEVMGHLARTYIKARQKPQELRNLLKTLAFQNPGGTWDQWARRRLLALGREE